MSSHQPLAAQRRKVRVGAACDFCRQRKFGCDNAKPKCENCHLYQKDCTYVVRIKKERPSNSRINHLEAENARLRRLLETLESAVAADPAQPEDDSSRAMSRPPPSPNLGENLPAEPQLHLIPQTSVQDANVSMQTDHKFAVESSDSQFHGPTSVMFDQEHMLRRLTTGSSVVLSATQKSQLLAETAKQRQLEHLNVRLGKLDFDGVEPKLAMNLLSVFWNRQHATGSVVYRPSFMRDMAIQGPYFSPLLLNAIFFVASKNTPGIQGLCSSSANYPTGFVFRQKVEDILSRQNAELLCKSRITTIQALLLVSDALFTWCDERSLSWHYLGIAINMIIDLGMHSEVASRRSKKQFSPEELEIRRRIFWAAFVLDKIQAIYQGRPARLRDMDSSVPVSFSDEFEELEPFDFVGYTLSPTGLGDATYSVSTFENLCKLSIIADHILCNLYAETSLEKSPRELVHVSQSLYTALKRWRIALPAQLLITLDATGSPNTMTGCVVLPHTLSLLSMYHALIILLHRPFVSGGHFASAAESTTSNAFEICEAAALKIDGLLRCYREAFCIKSPPYFISYATYVSGTIHVRTAALKRQESTAQQCLRNCLEILSEHQIICHAPRWSMSILLGLARRLHVDVGGDLIAYMSRTSDCGRLSTCRIDSAIIGSRPRSIEAFSQNSSNMQENALGMMPATKDVVTIAPQDSVLSLNTGIISTESLSTQYTRSPRGEVGPVSNKHGYDLEELALDMSFEFDPIFGSEMAEIDIFS